MAIEAKELSEKRRTLRETSFQYTGENPAKQHMTKAQFRKLDSSVKKCTGFIWKLRGSGSTDGTHKSLPADVRTLNLSRYMSEVVAAIYECKLCSSDVYHTIWFAPSFISVSKNFTINYLMHFLQLCYVRIQTRAKIYRTDVGTCDF